MSKNSINKTFIIEPAFITGATSFSACTTLYTNMVESCSGDTSMVLGTGTIIFNGDLYTNQNFTANTIDATTILSGGTNIFDIISPSVSGLPDVLAIDNTTSGNNIEVSNNDKINGSGLNAAYINFGNNGGNLNIVAPVSSVTKGLVSIGGAKGISLTAPYIYSYGNIILGNTNKIFNSNLDNYILLGDPTSIESPAPIKIVSLGAVNLEGSEIRLNPDSTIVNDDTLTDVLVRDTDGSIKYRTVDSIISGVTIPSLDYLPLSGGSVTGTTSFIGSGGTPTLRLFNDNTFRFDGNAKNELSTDSFNFTIPTGSPAAWYSGLSVLLTNNEAGAYVKGFISNVSGPNAYAGEFSNYDGGQRVQLGTPYYGVFSNGNVFVNQFNTTLKGQDTTSSYDTLTVQNLTGGTYFRLRNDKKLIYTDGSEGANKVLTSDANGVATWTTLSGGSVSGAYLPLSGGTLTGGVTGTTMKMGDIQMIPATKIDWRTSDSLLNGIEGANDNTLNIQAVNFGSLGIYNGPFTFDALNGSSFTFRTSNSLTPQLKIDNSGISGTTISATTFYGDGSHLTGISSAYLPLTGGTVTGNTSFINGELFIGNNDTLSNGQQLNLDFGGNYTMSRISGTYINSVYQGFNFYGYDNNVGSLKLMLHTSPEGFVGVNSSAHTANFYVLGKSGNNPFRVDSGNGNTPIFVSDGGLEIGFNTLTPSALVHIKGSGTTSAGYALKVTDSTNANLLSVNNDGSIQAATGFKILQGATSASVNGNFPIYGGYGGSFEAGFIGLTNDLSLGGGVYFHNSGFSKIYSTGTYDITYHSAGLHIFDSPVTASTISATTYYGDGSHLTGISSSDTRVTGITNTNNVITLYNNTGGTISTVFNTVTGLTADTITTPSIGTADNASLSFNTSGTTKATLTKDGFFGVNTIPTSTFEIRGIGTNYANAFQLLGSGGNNIISAFNIGEIHIGATGANQSYFDDNRLRVGGAPGSNAGTLTAKGVDSLNYNYAFSVYDGSANTLLNVRNDGLTTMTAVTATTVSATTLTTSNINLANTGLLYHALLRDSSNTGVLEYWQPNYFAQGGNGFGTDIIFGSVDNFGTYFMTNSLSRMKLDVDGNFGVGTLSPTARLHVKGSTADSTAYALNVVNSGNTNLLNVRNDGRINFNTSVDTWGTFTFESTGGNLVTAQGNSGMNGFRMYNPTLGHDGYIFMQSNVLGLRTANDRIELQNSSGNGILMLENATNNIGIGIGYAVGAKLHVVGAGTGTTYAFKTQNSGGDELFTVRNDGVISGVTYYGDGSHLTGIASNATVTGGTYSSGTTTFNNSTGGTFSVTGYTIGNEFWSASTGTTSVVKSYSDNTAGHYSTALGRNNKSDGWAGFIGGGELNTIYPNATYGVILAGSGNTIYNAMSPPPAPCGGPFAPCTVLEPHHTYNFIANGDTNQIQHLTTSCNIINGFKNEISSGNTYTSIINGANNFINTGSSYSIIVGGSANYIYGAQNIILNGASNRIYGGSSAILNSTGSTINSGYTATTIMGLSNFTANASDTLFTNNISASTITVTNIVSPSLSGYTSISVGTTAPASPSIGSLWIDTN